MFNHIGMSMNLRSPHKRKGVPVQVRDPLPLDHGTLSRASVSSTLTLRGTLIRSVAAPMLQSCFTEHREHCRSSNQRIASPAFCVAGNSGRIDTQGNTGVATTESKLRPVQLF